MKPQRQIIRIKFGSHLYGTSTPESDLDFKSVHVPAGRDILLQRVKEVTQLHTKVDSRLKNTADDVDDESFSLHKYLQLVAGGDMMATELLFAPPESWTDFEPDWIDLILANKASILNRQCKGFVGYCRKQAAKYGIKGSRVAAARASLALLDKWYKSNPMARVGEFEMEILDFVDAHEHTEVISLPAKGTAGVLRHWEVCGRMLPFTVRVHEAGSIMQKLVDNYGQRALAAEQNQGVDWKAMSHAVRVAQQSIEMLTTGHITFPRPNAAELLVIKRGERPYKDVAEQLEALLDEVEAVSDGSSLREESDQAVIDAIVLELYGQAVRS